MKSAFFFERTTAPSWSSRCSRKTSTSSPSLRACASLNSSIGTAPSDLNPTSRMTAVSVTRSTFDFTISPSSMLESVPSYSSVIFAISSAEYSSWRSDRTRRWEWRAGEGVSDVSGRSSVSTSIQYTGSVERLRSSPETTLRAADPGAVPRGGRNLPREALTRQRYHPRHLVLEREPRGVQQHRIRRRSERRDPPRRVRLIPGRERRRLPRQLLWLNAAPPAPSAPALPGPLGEPPPSPLRGAGGEEDLERRVRKNHGSDVAAVHHDPPGMLERRLALLHVHPVPHLGNRGQRRNPARHALGPNRLPHVYPRHLGPEDLVHQDQPHGQVLGEPDELLRAPPLLRPPSLVPEIVQRRQGDRPVQGTGVEMGPAEPPGHGGPGGALPGCRRPVDRDHPQAHVLPFPLPPSPMRRKSEKNRG